LALEYRNTYHDRGRTMTRHGLTLSITLLLLAGCASQPTAVQDRRLREAQATYARQDYAAAYRQAVQWSGIGGCRGRGEPAHAARAPAHRAGAAAAPAPAGRRATRAEAGQLAGAARAWLGLVCSGRGRYALAARALTAAAPRVAGED